MRTTFTFGAPITSSSGGLGIRAHDAHVELTSLLTFSRLCILALFRLTAVSGDVDWAGRNMTDSTQQLVSLVDVREHARRRRPWNRAFSGPALREYEEVIARRAEQLIEVLAAHTGEGKGGSASAGRCVGSFTYVSTISCLLSAPSPESCGRGS